MDIDMTAPPASAAEAGPSSLNNPAALLNLNPTAFVDDLDNSVHTHCAAGFDELDHAVCSDLGEELTPEQLVLAMQGTANLYRSLRTELKTRMQTFEQYALAESLKVPAGLMTPSTTAGSPEGEVDEAEEAAVEAQLVALRKQIAAAKHEGRAMQAEVAELGRLVDDLGGKLKRLEAVPGSLAGKENLMEDMRVMADKGAALAVGCDQLDALRRQLDGAAAAGAGGASAQGPEEMSEAEAERELHRRQQVMKSAAPEDLRKVREMMGVQ